MLYRLKPLSANRARLFSRRLIIKYNSLSADLDPTQLATAIFAEEAPMNYLDECTDRNDIDSGEWRELCEFMPLLAEAIAPACLTTLNYTALSEYLCGASPIAADYKPFAQVGTKFNLIAKAAVGFVKGLPVLRGILTTSTHWDRSIVRTDVTESVACRLHPNGGSACGKGLRPEMLNLKLLLKPSGAGCPVC
ncbi:MAG: hypothetical protein O3A00_17875 [Planctomycetota bacterium]|nr:hypothetical protein [Planctomycetota bacterium]